MHSAVPSGAMAGTLGATFAYGAATAPMRMSARISTTDATSRRTGTGTIVPVLTRSASERERNTTWLSRAAYVTTSVSVTSARASGLAWAALESQP